MWHANVTIVMSRLQISFFTVENGREERKKYEKIFQPEEMEICCFFKNGKKNQVAILSLFLNRDMGKNRKYIWVIEESE